MDAPLADLPVPDLAHLNRRRSDKWAGYEPDVLVSTIAEMDFPLAPAVAAALHAAVDRHDLGYAPADPAGLRDAFAGFAGRRLGWRVDPEQVTLVPDVMAGLVELCRVLAEPGDAVAFATPAYPPFYTDLPQAGVRLCEVPLGPDDTLDLDGLDAVLAAGARALVLANPHNPTGHVPARAELERIAERCAAHDAWVLADEIHAPLVLPGASPHAVARAVGRRPRVRHRAHVGVEGVQSRRPQGGAGRHRLRSRPPGRRPAARPRRPGRPARGDRRRGGLRRRRPVARRGAGAARRQPEPARRPARRGAAGGPLVAAPGHLPRLARLPRAGARRDDPAAAFLARGRVALSRGLDYGPPGAGHVRLNFGTSPELVAEMVERMASAL